MGWMSAAAPDRAAFTIADRDPHLWLTDDLMSKDGSLRDGLRMAFFRSSADVLADVGSDVWHWYARCLISKITGRLGVAAIMLGLSLPLLGFGARWALLAVPLIIGLTMNAVLAFLVAAALAAFDGRYWWLPPILVLGTTVYRRQVEPQREVVLSLGSWRPVSLLPRREFFRLSLRRKRFVVASALDLALAGFPERALRSASAASGVVDDRTPTCNAMLTLVEALVAFEEGDHSRALKLADRAQNLAKRGAPAARAWILIEEARLLANLGDPFAARRLVVEALGCAPERAYQVRMEGNLLRGRLSQDAGDQQETLSAIHAARVASVRRKSLLGLLQTELALLEALDQAPETQAAVIQWLIDFARGGYLNAVPIPNEVVGAVELYGGEAAWQRHEHANAAEHFARAAMAYERAHNPIQEATALGRMAELLRAWRIDPTERPMTREQQEDEPLEFALKALSKLNAVRYALPTARWREAWLRATSRNYDFALREAIDCHRVALAAGLIELSKSQAVSLIRSQRDLKRTSLESLTEASVSLADRPAGQMRESTASDAVGALLDANPVHPPLTPIVAGARALNDTQDEGLDVDGVVVAAAGLNAFYLSGLMSGSDYLWSVRLPGGHWHTGRVSMKDGSSDVAAVEALLSALPTRMLKEPETSYVLRVARSPLFAANTPAGRQAESDLLTAAGAVLIPPLLWQALNERYSGAGRRPRLIVSMTGVLAAVPIAFLGAREHENDQRLVELADLQLLPSIQLSAHLGARRPRGSGGWPVRAVGAFPLGDVTDVASPPWVHEAVDHSVPDEDRKQRLIELLNQAHSEGPAATAYLSGHLASAHSRGLSDPLLTGLMLSEKGIGDGAYLTVRDLLTGVGGQSVRMPERLLLLACSSSGIVTETDSGDGTRAGLYARWPTSGEWTGFGAACVLAGARAVICTHFDQLDSPETTTMDHQVAQMLETVDDPVAGLGAIQRSWLHRWRNGEANAAAITAMCYAIFSC
jgi:hypothetical protein